MLDQCDTERSQKKYRKEAGEGVRQRAQRAQRSLCCQPTKHSNRVTKRAGAVLLLETAGHTGGAI